MFSSCIERARLLQNVFSYCTECVLLLYRVCRLTTECVLWHRVRNVGPAEEDVEEEVRAGIQEVSRLVTDLEEVRERVVICP